VLVAVDEGVEVLVAVDVLLGVEVLVGWAVIEGVGEGGKPPRGSATVQSEKDETPWMDAEFEAGSTVPPGVVRLPPEYLKMMKLFSSAVPGTSASR
jgi:hypothetical protein